MPTHSLVSKNMEDQLSIELDEMLATDFEWLSEDSHEDDFVQKLAQHMKIHDEISTLTSSTDTQYEDRCKQLEAEVAKWKAIAQNHQLQLQSLKSRIKHRATRNDYAKKKIMEIYAI